MEDRTPGTAMTSMNHQDDEKNVAGPTDGMISRVDTTPTLNNEYLPTVEKLPAVELGVEEYPDGGRGWIIALAVSSLIYCCIVVNCI